jgi:hypothetical protein
MNIEQPDGALVERGSSFRVFPLGACLVIRCFGVFRVEGE